MQQEQHKGEKARVILAGLGLWTVLLGGGFFIGKTVWSLGSSFFAGTPESSHAQQKPPVRAEKKPDISAASTQEEAKQAEILASSEQAPAAVPAAQPEEVIITPPAAQQADSSAESFVIPDSAKRKLQEGDVSGLSASQLRLARNEIFARHGYVFQSHDLRDYFAGKAWYEESADFTGGLSAVEVQNVELLKRKEAQLAARQ